MSEKRRDHRGRILHNGEIQLSDGRYRFKYVDEMGKERCVYSWRLDHNDATPKGKRRTLSLREMEKKIQADHFEQIATNGGNMTVLELVATKFFFFIYFQRMCHVGSLEEIQTVFQHGIVRFLCGNGRCYCQSTENARQGTEYTVEPVK